MDLQSTIIFKICIVLWFCCNTVPKFCPLTEVLYECCLRSLVIPVCHANSYLNYLWEVPDLYAMGILTSTMDGKCRNCSRKEVLPLPMFPSIQICEIHWSISTHYLYNMFIITIDYSKNLTTIKLLTIEHMAKFVVKYMYIVIQINGQVYGSVKIWPPYACLVYHKNSWELLLTWNTSFQLIEYSSIYTNSNDRSKITVANMRLYS